MKYLKTALVLCLIALFCSAAIAGVNMLTEQTIIDNANAAKEETIKSIFADYDKVASGDPLSLEGRDSAIVEIILAKNSANEELGYLYTATGKNAYGPITIMVAIVNDTVYQVEFLENGQSFASTVVEHVKGNYPSSKEEKIIISFYTKDDEYIEISALDEASLNAINTKCGATFGANTVKELVLIALNDERGA